MKKITVFFGILFVVATIILVGLGFLESFTIQSEYDNDRVERYEKMQLKDTKAVITDNTLEEDHRVCVENSEKMLDFWDNVHMGILGICVAWCVFLVLVFLSILSKSRHYVFVRTFFLSILTLAILAGSAYSAKIIYGREEPYPDNPNYDYLKESFKYVEVSVNEKKDKGSDNKDGYFIVTTDGKEFEIDRIMYDRIDDMGTYYLAQTENSGKVLNLYSGEKFQLEQK
ncbi:hypothetical protein SAMN02745111_01185 [Eubacterium uniforme]|uniref:Uncharacterized protein n=1 Tax=Eubacterium uniforme TaxID=39495 RepID=A0A1T4VLD2_9FIRM|nr:hypothetical protein [Eubacterium uniforme]SKA65743.1 hypothetical protein SAMN02745111_01185 [Eubacterium uniforme]